MLLGLLQNDASLLACRLAQLRDLVDLDTATTPDAVGAGYVENGQALVRRRPGSALSVSGDLLDLVSDVKASGLLLHVRRATVGGFKDENTHPFRYRNWLFAHTGTVARFGDLRPSLLEELPPFLQRMIVGETDSEHIFALFLNELRCAGALETLCPDPETLGKCLAQTVDKIEALAREVGATAESTLNIVATNGCGLIACRHGDGPGLHYAELGGLSVCEQHGLGEDAPETHAQLVSHKNVRSVVVTSRLHPGVGLPWKPLPRGQILSVGPDLTANVRAY